MPNRRDTRRLAMQLLYQLDMRGQGDLELIREGLQDGPDTQDVRVEALQLAQAAWASRADADAVMTELAPDWPTHRQPPVDRAVLRLAYYEMASAHAPAKVVINEAIELAKTFCSEQSPAFVNGLLDKAAKRLAPTAPGTPGTPGSAPESAPESGETPSPDAPAASPDDWLDDAKGDDV